MSENLPVRSPLSLFIQRPHTEIFIQHQCDSCSFLGSRPIRLFSPTGKLDTFIGLSTGKWLIVRNFSVRMELAENCMNTIF